MKTLILHPLAIGATVLSLVIVVGSAVYYVAGSKVPAVPTFGQPSASSIITGYGTVESAENGDLTFGSSGRVTMVGAAVGAHVTAGEMLASLDTASLGAARDQAAAALSAKKAQLAQLEAPPRPVDIEQKRTAVDQAGQALATDYANIATNVRNAYSKTYEAVHSLTDGQFDHPASANPSLVFSTREASVGAEAEHDRLVVNDDLAVWKAELAGLDAGSEEALDDVLRHSIAHVEVAQTYANALVAALANAVQTNSFNATSLVTANANAGVLRDTLAGLLTPLESSAQKIDADKLAEKSAKDALAQAQAGATDEDINAAQAAVAGAQAALDAANVALNDARVVAPFAGTVASVNVKSGDWVTSGATAVSLVPAQALQVTAYFSQADAAELAVGDDAVVTLDAYGNSRPFAARVASIDSSPTMRDNTSAYKVVLEFDHADPAIWAGMSASVTITK